MPTKDDRTPKKAGPQPSATATSGKANVVSQKPAAKRAASASDKRQDVLEAIQQLLAGEVDENGNPWVPEEDIPADIEWESPPTLPADPCSGQTGRMFVNQATTLAIHYATQLGNGKATPDEQRKIEKRLKRVLKDIKKQLRECPMDTGGAVTEPSCCRQCLGQYNTCIASGKSQAYCMNLYNNCVAGCNPSC